MIEYHCLSQNFKNKNQTFERGDEMQIIRVMHLLFAQSLPVAGSRFLTHCGRELPFEGFLPTGMADGRICKECSGKINGYSVLSGCSGLKCFVVVEYGEGSYSESSWGN